MEGLGSNRAAGGAGLYLSPGPLRPSPPLPHRRGAKKTAHLATPSLLTPCSSGPFLENLWEAGATRSNHKSPRQEYNRALNYTECPTLQWAPGLLN